jgi:tRNA splicing ligase
MEGITIDVPNEQGIHIRFTDLNSQQAQILQDLTDFERRNLMGVRRGAVVPYSSFMEEMVKKIYLYRVVSRGNEPQSIVIHPEDYDRMNEGLRDVMRTVDTCKREFMGLRVLRSIDLEVGEIIVI